MLPLSITQGIQLPDFSKLRDTAAEFLAERFRFGAVKAPVFKTPLDVFVDNIFVYLTIEDILSLRRVNKGFHLLSFEPIIWKRFLERMDFPVPPLRPTFRYSLTLTDFEVEQLVTRSITVDDNWRQRKPKIYNIQGMHSMNRVNDMFLLPGGRYLIASVNDVEFRYFSLIIFMLDHPYGSRALAQIPTFSKAYNIQAKYVRIKPQEDGMVITYVRRRFIKPQPAQDNPSKYSHEYPIDVPGGFAYQAVTIYTKLNLLETMRSPDLDPKSAVYQQLLRQLPGPFEELAIAATSFEITQTSLFERGGKCYMAMINEPAELHIINVLNKKEHAVVAFKAHASYPDSPHRVRAFRVYPEQNDMIVIRSVAVGPGDEIHLIEWYELPLYTGIVQITPKTRYSIKDKKVRKFHISDYGIPNRSKLYPDHPTLKHTRGPPPPVSIYLEREEPYGIEHHAIYPQQIHVAATPSAPAHFKYVYNHDSYQMSNHICAPHRAKVLPGSTRAVVCLLQGDDRTESPKMVSLRRYIHPLNAGLDYLPDPVPELEPEPVLRKNERLAVPKMGVYATFESGDLIEQMNNEGGLRAITWDEATGRICMASEDKMLIRIVDCSDSTLPDARSEVWKRRRMMLLERLPPLP